MTYGTSTSNNAKMAQVIQANLANVGINAGVKVMEAAFVTPKLYAQDYDICVFADSMNYDFNNIRQQVHSESKGMYVVKYQGGPFNWQKMESWSTRAPPLPMSPSAAPPTPSSGPW